MAPIKLYFFDTENFGDALSGMLVSHLSGRKVVVTSSFEAEMSAVGSILRIGDLCRNSPHSTIDAVKYLRRKVMDFLSPKLKVWGTGFLKVQHFDSFARVRNVEVLATRGELTRTVLRRYGFLSEKSKVVLGDPGLLYPLLMQDRPSVKYEVGLVPHEDDFIFGKYLEGKLLSLGVRVKFIDVHSKNPLSVLDEIASCERILSSSLHGCVVADALGIPNRMLLLSYFGRPAEQHLFKYRDYYSAYGLDIDPLGYEALLEKLSETLRSVCTKYKVSASQVAELKAGLLRTFPFKKEHDE